MAALPPLVSVAEFAAWVGESIPDNDPRALAYLAGASARVRSYTGRTWVDPDTKQLLDVPDDVATVVKQVAERKWRNPAGFVQETTGPFTVRYPDRPRDGLYLTEDEQAMLDPYKYNGRRQLWTMRIDGHDDYLDTVFVDVEGGGDPFPLYDRYDLGEV